MFRSLLLASALAFFAACASNPEPMRTSIAASPRYHPPDPSVPVVNGHNPTVVGESAWQSEAAKWIGAPFRPGGNNRAGMDALQLVRRMYENVARIQLSSDLNELARTGIAIPRDQLRPGDIIFFTSGAARDDHPGDNQFHKQTNITGAAIYISDNRIVTALPTIGVAYGQLNDPQFSGNYNTARRILR